MHSAAGRDLYDRELSDLVGELSTRSDEFRVRWATYNVKRHRTSPKVLHHHVVGDLSLHTETLELARDPGLTLVTYTAEPGSASQDGLHLLASWTSSSIREVTPAEHHT